MRGYWKTWMTAWCWVTVALGVLLAGAAWPAVDGGARLYFRLVGNFTSDAAVFDPPAMRLTVGVLGAVLIGWGLTILGLVRAAEVGAPMWKSLTFAVIVWFAVDSTLSISRGYPLNAVSNALFLATYLAPVLGSGILRARGRAATA